jgi:hypothetical protein
MSGAQNGSRMEAEPPEIETLSELEAAERAERLAKRQKAEEERRRAADRGVEGDQRAGQPKPRSKPGPHWTSTGKATNYFDPE